jgi:hypothetical protein
MLRKTGGAVLLVLALMGMGAGVTLWATRPRPPPLDPPALVTQIREVARLETLDVTLYKKVSFDPDPEPSGTLLGDALTWAKFTLRPPHGRAIVFAVVHLGMDLAKLKPQDVRLSGSRVEVRLPPWTTSVELKPGETEIIGSTLDSKQTAQLLEVAKEAFENEVRADVHLREKAKASAEQALRLLFFQLGYRDVVFDSVSHSS